MIRATSRKGGLLDIEAGAETAGVDAERKAAGEPAVGPHRCAACGYGVAVYRVLPACPMCKGDLWVAHPSGPARFDREP